MLTIITSAASTDLTVLATVKAELGITNRADDEKLTGYIRQASDVVAKYCNRVFALETVTETFRLAHRRDELILSRFPVASVASVVENEATLAAADYEVECDTGALLRLWFDAPTCWPRGKIVITYATGFDLPAGLPQGVERAAILLVKQYATSGDRDSMVRIETIDGAGSTEYFNAAGFDLPPEVEGLLTPHRKPING
ncbi:MAG: phage head-tail connector protein [Bradyrhizobium sp.]